MKRYCLLMAVLSLAAGSVTAHAEANRFQGRALPASVEALKLEAPITTFAAHPRLSRDLVQAEGLQRVIVRLKGAPVARGGNKADIEIEQAQFLQRCGALPSAHMVAQVNMVLNAVFLEIDAVDLAALAADSAVSTIKKVVDYELDLSETVPYIGATAAQSFGADGEGISVAVLDSGIDYNHANLGGSGDPADYLANDPNIVEPGSFPTAKVAGGFDFTGSDWPNTPETPDPDPLDDGPASGHGSHVADIIGGSGGVAPGVDLYAVKVCSSVATSCSGIALIQGMDFAVDPNGDGDPKDAVNIINMSLGSNYGSPFNDDLSAAVDNATAMGVLTVSSAGNGGDKPYVQGSPSGAPTAIAVAQTTVPSAFSQFMDITNPPVGNVDAVFQIWSAPLSGVIAGPVTYGDGAGGNLNGCAAFDPGSLSGIVLVDRGACNFTLKIKNINDAGGTLGIIGLVDGSAPFSGGDGGDRPITIPGFMISQANANLIIPVGSEVSFEQGNGLALVMSMVGSSSRGPQGDDNRIKPEIGAPGASVSAVAGTGVGVSPFGGTSGASPMVAGAAAQLLSCRNDADNKKDKKGKKEKDKKPNKKDITLFEAKSLLMNTAYIDILNDALIGDLAPISRIGGGEVRVDSAAVSAASAWDNDDPFAGGSLSFGQVDVADSMVQITKSVRVRNRSGKKITYNITPTFRFADDMASGAISVSAPSSITVKGNKTGKPSKDTVFDVTLTIDGSLLPGNFMNSGSLGADGAALTANEFDGYLMLEPMDDDSDSDSDSDSDGKKLAKTCKENKLSAEPIHLAWHVLPRQAARVVASTNELQGGGFPEVINLNNTGVGVAQNDPYSLIALSPNIPEGGNGQQSPTPDIASVGINTFPVPAGFCSGQDSFLWAFAINSHERQRHLVQPVSYQISLDTNQDGQDDYVVLNRDLSFNNVTDGRQLAWVFDLSDGSTSAFFFAEHATNTGNTVLLICGEQIGLSGPDILATNVDITSIFAQDFYFGGPGDEAVFPNTVTVTPLGEQYYALPNDVAGNTNDPFGLPVYDFGPFPGNTPELGVLMFTNGDRGAGARGGATEDTEAQVFTAPGVVVP